MLGLTDYSFAFYVVICFVSFHFFRQFSFSWVFFLDFTVFLVCEFLLELVLLSSLYTAGHARTNVSGSRISFVIASVRSSIH